jgi:hypothetical protein
MTDLVKRVGLCALDGGANRDFACSGGNSHDWDFSCSLFAVIKWTVGRNRPGRGETETWQRIVAKTRMG